MFLVKRLKQALLIIWAFVKSIHNRNSRFESEWHKTLKTGQFYVQSDEGEKFLILEFTHYWYSRVPFGSGLTKGSIMYKTEQGFLVRRLQEKTYEIIVDEDISIIAFHCRR